MKNPIIPIHKLELLKARYSMLEDRSEHVAIMNFRTSFHQKENFEFVCKYVEGEKPSVVLRRLIREYIEKNLPE